MRSKKESLLKTEQFQLCRKAKAVFSKTQTKHTNTHSGQRVNFFLKAI